MSPIHSRLYWACGGEVVTLGGPLRLSAPGDAPTGGCRPLTPPRAAELRASYVRQARASADRTARRYCLACAAELKTAIRDVGRWRRAA